MLKFKSGSVHSSYLLRLIVYYLLMNRLLMDRIIIYLSIFIRSIINNLQYN